MAASTSSYGETSRVRSFSTRPTASRSPRASSPKAWMRLMHRRYQVVPPEREGLRLADLEANEPGDGHACLVEQRLDGLLVVGHRRLIEQHDVLVEPGHATLDDLGHRLLGLALVARGLLGDAALVGDDILGHIVAGEVLGFKRGDLQCDRMRGPGAFSVGTRLVLDQHTD